MGVTAAGVQRVGARARPRQPVAFYARTPGTDAATRRALNALYGTEKRFQQRIVNLARGCGWTVHFAWQSVHSPAGAPDLELCRPPRYLRVELKLEGGAVTVAQAAYLALLARCPGIETYLWTPGMAAEIERVLAPEQDAPDAPDAAAEPAREEQST